MSHYFRLLWRGGFRIHYSAIAMTLAIAFYSVCNSILSLTQKIFLGRKISRTRIEKPPVFIVGHWRSGTTLIHELMSLDEELAAPTTYQCFTPHHFLISEWMLKWIVGLALPKTRPMDNMASGPDRPQEDEFAICALGAPSPYASMAFPNQPRQHQDTIDMKGVSDEDKAKLREAMQSFALSLTLKNKKRLLFKSPTHTGRIEFLRELFPGAKFLHICRDPQNVIPSTIRLWRHLDSINGFEIPRYDDASIEDYVGKTFAQMYEAFSEQTREKQDDIFTVHYEEAVADPIAALKKAYDFFDLEGFENLEPKLEEYMENQGDYKKNQHHLNDQLKAKINEHCHSYQQTYGYDKA